MTSRTIIKTDRAPAAIGTYSQAVRVGNTVYCSGQIPLDPDTMTLVSDEFEPQCQKVFQNMRAVAEASGGSLQDIVKMTVFLTDLANFPTVNEVMAAYFKEPYPSRAAVGVAALPKDVQIEVDAIMELDN